MIPIRTFEDLVNSPQNPRQHWYYVILVNAIEPSIAAKKVLLSLDMFDYDAGERCDYFLPGYECYGKSDYQQVAECLPLPEEPTAFLQRLGRIPFSGRDFVQFYLDVENQVNGSWQYSGRCEMLIFNINPESRRIDADDFYSYDLDDIVKNDRSITEFIRKTITISQNGLDKYEAKKALDEYYADLVMPAPGQQANEYIYAGNNAFRQSGFEGREYSFISYSSKDYLFVSKVRELLEEHGIRCWMAPYDIPRGTSYPYVIEQAIKHASTFILMLSHNSVRSVWVRKELCRAIDLFGDQNADRICVAWRDGSFPLEGTDFALPLEDVQIKTDLQDDPNNWPRICGREADQTDSKAGRSNNPFIRSLFRRRGPDIEKLKEAEEKKNERYKRINEGMLFLVYDMLKEMEIIYYFLDESEKSTYMRLRKIREKIQSERMESYPHEFADPDKYIMDWDEYNRVFSLLRECQRIINRQIKLHSM